MGDVECPGVVMMGEMAQLFSVRRCFDYGEGGVRNGVDILPAPLLCRNGGSRHQNENHAERCHPGALTSRRSSDANRTPDGAGSAVDTFPEVDESEDLVGFFPFRDVGIRVTESSSIGILSQEHQNAGLAPAASRHVMVLNDRVFAVEGDGVEIQVERLARKELAAIQLLVPTGEQPRRLCVVVNPMGKDQNNQKEAVRRESRKNW